MAIKGLKSTQLANDPTTSALKFNFKTYEQKNSPFRNNSTDIDFVTYNGSLYVCVEDGVTYKAGNPADNGFLLLVQKGADGRQGIDGKEGPMGPMPNYSLSFDGKQMVVIEQPSGVRKAVSPDLTGPVWIPELHDRKIVWVKEEANAGTRPADIDLDLLTPKEERPLLLRTNSDNTKRDDETSGPANMIQWKHEGDQEWTNLISISELMNLTLAGVSFWQDPDDDNAWHFGHKEVVKATYSSDKGTTKIIAVDLGEVLFDAGKVPFPDNSVDLETMQIDLGDIKTRLGVVELKLSNLGNYALKSEIPTKVSQLENDVPYISKPIADATYQKIGNYVKKVNGYLPNADGEVTIPISAGDYSLFDLVTRTVNGSRHLIKIVNGTETDLGVFGTGDGSGSGSGCDRCWTEEDIQGLIADALDGLDIPSDYVRQADLNGFVQISDLVNYATKNYVDSRIADAMTGQSDLDYYRIFTLYQRTNSRTTAPAAPIQGNFVWDTSKGEIVLQNQFTSNWENHPQNATSATPYLWQATATYSYKSKSEVKGDDETEYWHVVCLTGEPGIDGADGNGVEFIYRLVDSLSEFNALTTPEAPGTGADSYPEPWQDHPEGISEEHPIEAASMRSYNGVTKTWGPYCAPFIWAMWGEDGTDGDGVEYIFHVDASDTLSNALIPVQTLDDIYYKTNNEIDYSRPKPGYENYDSSDWVPDGQNGRPDQNWSDNPSDVDEQQPYEWVSIRKYNGQTGHWGPFSEPKIWGLWGQKTVIQQEVVSGTTVYKSYNCYAFTRTNLDISGYRVTGGQAYEDPLDGIVTKNGNTVVQMTWSDGIPNGTEQLWSIQALIGDESQSSDAAWSSPARVGDRAGFQVEFAASDANTDAVYNKTKTLPSLNNYLADTPEGVDEVAWENAASTANCGSWSDTSDDNTVYMAESRIIAGSWTPWNVIKIKGEKGTAGEDGVTITMTPSTQDVHVNNSNATVSSYSYSPTINMRKGNNTLTIVSVTTSYNYSGITVSINSSTKAITVNIAEGAIIPSTQNIVFTVTGKDANLKSYTRIVTYQLFPVADKSSMNLAFLDLDNTNNDVYVDTYNKTILSFTEAVNTSVEFSIGSELVTLSQLTGQNVDFEQGSDTASLTWTTDGSEKSLSGTITLGSITYTVSGYYSQHLQGWIRLSTSKDVTISDRYAIKITMHTTNGYSASDICFVNPVKSEYTFKIDDGRELYKENEASTDYSESDTYGYIELENLTKNNSRTRYIPEELIDSNATFSLTKDDDAQPYATINISDYIARHKTDTGFPNTPYDTALANLGGNYDKLIKSYSINGVDYITVEITEVKPTDYDDHRVAAYDITMRVQLKKGAHNGLTGFNKLTWTLNNGSYYDQETNYVAFNGVDGKSAYEVAVDNGFEGNESQWLTSLKGQNGVSTTTPYRGNYSSTETYYGNSVRTDIVYDELTKKYYRANPEAPTSPFINQAPATIVNEETVYNTDYWIVYGNTYENVATKLAFVEDLTVVKLNTAGQSGRTSKIVAQNNTLYATDNNGEQVFTLSGDPVDVGNTGSFTLPPANPYGDSVSYTTTYVQNGSNIERTDHTQITLFEHFAIGYPDTVLQIPQVVIDFLVDKNGQEDYWDVTNMNAKLQLYKSDNNGNWLKVGNDLLSGTSDGNLTAASPAASIYFGENDRPCVTTTVGVGHYKIVAFVEWTAELNDPDSIGENWITLNVTGYSNENLKGTYTSTGNQVSIGSNGLVINVNGLRAIFAVNNNESIISFVNALGSGLRVTSSGVQISTDGGTTWKAVATQS